MRKLLEQFWINYQNGLIKTGLVKNPSDFVKRVFFKSCGVGIVVWIVTALVLQETVFSAVAGLVIGSVFCWMRCFEPFEKRKMHSKLVERDLPFGLMALSVELNLKIPFETALSHVVQSGYGKASEEFRIVLQEVNVKGASVPEAFLHLGERLDSQLVRRSVSSLVNAYELGPKVTAGEPVRRIAVELLSIQRAQGREFSGKIAVFSLLFISVSAIVPALFQSMVIVGSLFLQLDLSPLLVMTIVGIGFPLLDAGILWYIRAKTPVFLRD